MKPLPTESRIRIDTQLDPRQSEVDLAQLRRGLQTHPKRLPSKYFYDQRGSELFEEITRLPEYYPTRVERTLLLEVADELSDIAAAEELVELGAGAATKTRVLLDAMQRTGLLRLYVPFDVSESEVRRVAEELATEYPSLWIHGIVADFVHHLTALPAGSPRLVMLLGSTIGNYSRGQAVELLGRLAQHMSVGDFFLLGADLVKDADCIEAAYNDSRGVTAEFNRNILRVVNQITDGDFRPELFSHSAVYNSQLNRIEMHLVAKDTHRVELPLLDLSLQLEKDERICTEISCKYDRTRVKSMLAEGGFRLTRWFTDRNHLFALALAQRT